MYRTNVRPFDFLVVYLTWLGHKTYKTHLFIFIILEKIFGVSVTFC